MPNSDETFWDAVARIAAAQREILNAIRKLADVPSAPVNMDRLRAKRSRREKRMNNHIVEQCAMHAHEANRAHCRANGDNSQPRWKDAPAWQRDSAIEGVKAILNDPTMTPEKSHEGWAKHKIANGWVYGPVKNAEQKRHPCLVPYAQLSEEQRVKDAIFLATVRSVATILKTVMGE